MPKKEKSVPLNNIDRETTLAIAYQVMKNLGWTILFAGENKIQGATQGKWKTPGQQIMVGEENGQLTVTSEMVSGETMDIVGRNSKNIAAFEKEWQAVIQAQDQEKIIENKVAIDALRIETQRIAHEQAQQHEELAKAMKLDGSNLYATYAIMGVNILIFAIMATQGAGLFDANGYVHLKWGSNYGPLTLSGDWWRLFTCMFLHFGIIHLALNMYCLYSIGVYLEPMLGKAKYIAGYLCTGVLASLVSVWWHNDTNSAGASGAVFGLYGLFFALLTTNLIPKLVRDQLLKSIALFIFYNLVFGLKSGVDNAAHIGGLISGFAIGYLYVFSLKKEREQVATNWVPAAVVVGTIAISAVYLSSHAADTSKRVTILAEVRDANYADNEKYNLVLNEVANLEEKALGYFKESDSLKLITNITEQVLPLWNQMETKAKQMDSYDVSSAKHVRAKKLFEYVQLRKQESQLMVKELSNTAEEDNLSAATDSVRQQISNVIKEIEALQ